MTILPDGSVGVTILQVIRNIYSHCIFRGYITHEQLPTITRL